MVRIWTEQPDGTAIFITSHRKLFFAVASSTTMIFVMLKILAHAVMTCP